MVDTYLLYYILVEILLVCRLPPLQRFDEQYNNNNNTKLFRQWRRAATLAAENFQSTTWYNSNNGIYADSTS